MHVIVNSWDFILLCVPVCYEAFSLSFFIKITTDQYSLTPVERNTSESMLYKELRLSALETNNKLVSQCKLYKVPVHTP